MLRTAARHVFKLLPPAVQESVRVKYLDRQKRKALASVGATDVAVADINHLLHHLRGEALQQLPKNARHFVSVGCAGTWYFNWIEQMVGRMERHTGIEFYSPRPTDLPSNVVWIANTAGSMPEIGDSTADILFSGQNVEHLWPEDITNFLLESHRVLKNGGLLVIDSPNRRITAKLEWSQPEHTIELNPQEILELLDLAGYDVEKKRGIWLCEDPQTGKTLPLEDLSSSGSWPLSRRVAEARDNLDSSFIWWIEARKSDRQPQKSRLSERVQAIYDIAWPERLNRLMTLTGAATARNGEAWLDSGGRAGPLLYGPYAPLCAGRYSVTFDLVFPDAGLPSVCGAVCEAVANGGNSVLARGEAMTTDANAGTAFKVTLDFSVPDTLFGVEFRVMGMGDIRVLTKRALVLTRHGDL